MATSIIRGLLDQGFDPEQLRASDPHPDSLQKLQEATGISTSADNNEMLRGADIVILAVKPQVMSQVTADIRELVTSQNTLVISIAAGITIDSMCNGLGQKTAIVRCMPNTPALLGMGATALYATDTTNPAQLASAEKIMAAVGTVCWVKEEVQLDAVTALSGSGPAYFFLYMELMADAGVKLGLDADTSRNLAIQTGLGASLMAQSDVGLEELRRRVTSPGGTTERAIQSFQDAGLRDTIEGAMAAAFNRAQEMAKEMA